MSIDTEDELQALRRVGRVVRLTLERMRRALRPGITTAELDEIGAGVLAEHGARSAPRMVYGFPKHVLISVNDEAVHGIPSERRIRPGDLVKLDVTAELGGFMADAAVTVPVPPVSDVARRLADTARDAFRAAMAVARPGFRVNDLGRTVEATVTKAGFTVLRGLNGHGIGRTIHEPPQVPNHFDPQATQPLTEGLVITVEPIIAQSSRRAVEGRDGWTVRTAGGDLAAHYEHTLVITKTRPILLTAA